MAYEPGKEVDLYAIYRVRRKDAQSHYEVWPDGHPTVPGAEKISSRGLPLSVAERDRANFVAADEAQYQRERWARRKTTMASEDGPLQEDHEAELARLRARISDLEDQEGSRHYVCESFRAIREALKARRLWRGTEVGGGTPTCALEALSDLDRLRECYHNACAEEERLREDNNALRTPAEAAFPLGDESSPTITIVQGSIPAKRAWLLADSPKLKLFHVELGSKPGEAVGYIGNSVILTFHTPIPGEAYSEITISLPESWRLEASVSSDNLYITAWLETLAEADAARLLWEETAVGTEES